MIATSALLLAACLSMTSAQQSTTSSGRTVYCTNPPYVSCGVCSTEPWPTAPAQIRKVKVIPMSRPGLETRNIMTFSVREVVYYRAKNANYSLVGSVSVTCLANGQWSKPPSCKREYFCSIPTVTNAKCSSADGNLVRMNQKANCTCASGYVLNGPGDITCKRGNVWPELYVDDNNNLIHPYCQVLTTTTTERPYGCYNGPPVIRNGVCAKVGAGAVFLAGDKASCTCKPGFALNSLVQPTCQGRGRFAQVPTCVRVLNGTSGINCTKPPEVAGAGCDNCEGYGNKTRITSFRPGDQATYQCQPGFYMQGNPVVTCLLSGAWSNPPRCIAGSTTPKGVRCQGIPTIANGFCVVQDDSLDQMDDDDSEFQVGTEVQCSCGAGSNAKLIGSSAVICLTSGLWSTKPRCQIQSTTPSSTRPTEPSGCEIPRVTNGYCNNAADDASLISSTVVEIGSNIFCQCDDGYYRPAVDPVPRNGLSQGSRSVSGRQLTSTPRRGRTSTLNAGTSSLKTRSTSKRTPPLSSRTTGLMTSRTGRTTNAILSGNRNNRAQRGGSARSLLGTARIELTCQSGAVWSEDASKFHCVIKPKCGQVPTLANGYCQNENLDDNELGDGVQCFCHSGYAFSGQVTFSRCSGSGTWTPISPCVATLETTTPVRNGSICRNPWPTITNGVCGETVRFASVNVGDQVPCRCKPGFSFADPDSTTAICRGGNRWLNPVCVPTVVGTNCTMPPEVAGAGCDLCSGYTTPRSKQSFQPGDVAVYECNEGYSMIGKGEVTCLDSGRWTDAPECIKDPTTDSPEGCLSLPRMLNGRCIVVNDDDQSDSLRIGTVLECSCAQDMFKLVGEPFVKCVGKNQWSQLPTCFNPNNEKLCEIPQIPNGFCSSPEDEAAAFYSSAVQPGAIVHCECDAGFRRVDVRARNGARQQRRRSTTTTTATATRRNRPRRAVEDGSTLVIVCESVDAAGNAVWSDDLATFSCQPFEGCDVVPNIDGASCRSVDRDSVECQCPNGVQFPVHCIDGAWERFVVSPCQPLRDEAAPPSDANVCKTVPTVNEGKCESLGERGYALVGEQVMCYCRSAFNFETDSMATCRGNNRWLVPTCVRTD